MRKAQSEKLTDDDFKRPLIDKKLNDLTKSDSTIRNLKQSMGVSKSQLTMSSHHKWLNFDPKEMVGDEGLRIILDKI